MVETVEFYLDFRSAYCFLCIPLLETIVRDYDVRINIFPHKLTQSKIMTAQTAYQKKMAEYELMDALRYAQLLGYDLNNTGYEVDTTVALIGILFMNERKPNMVLSYSKKVFQHMWTETNTFLDVDSISGIMASFGIDCAGFAEFVKSTPEWKLRYGPAHSVFDVPCFRMVKSDNSVARVYYGRHNISLIRNLLHEQRRFRRIDVAPDVSCAYRFPEPKISKDIYGMPNTGLGKVRLQRYKNRSRTKAYSNGRDENIDVYIDIKSPHAYLAIEMTMALEEDFDINVNFLPFDFDIGGVFGKSTKSPVTAPGTIPITHRHDSPEENTRSIAQLKVVKNLYADCRELARFQKTKIMGTNKVFDSTLALIAMLWTKHLGREYLDQYLENIYPLMWTRMINIEDYHELIILMVKLDIPIKHRKYGSFREYVAVKGPSELTQIMKVAQRRNVLGVPTYVLDDEVFFGKEHLSLIRLRLFEKGLKSSLCTLHNPVDVPYLWRPLNDKVSARM